MINVPNRASVFRSKYSFPSLFTFLLGIVLLFSSTTAYATFTDITGTYSGTVIDTESSCVFDPLGSPTPVPADPPESVSMTLTINSFNTSTGDFSGTGTEGPFSDGETDSIIFSGIVDSAGNVFSSSFTATESNGDQIAGDFNGSNIKDGQFAVDAAGQDVIPNSYNVQCQIDAVGTLLLTGGADVIVTPEITPSSTIISIIDFTSQIQAVTSDLGARIQNVMRGTGRGLHANASGLKLEGMSGLNAGDGMFAYGAWLSYSYSDFDNDLSSTAYDGDRHSVLGGFDFAPWESTVIGIAVGYEDSDIDTTFNQGELETDGYTIAPYFGALLSDTWSVNFSFGYSNIDYDQFRTAPGTTTRITSSTEADRWFGMFNLNGVTYYDNWILGVRVGTLWARNEVDAFVESNGNLVPEVRSKLGTWSIGGDAAYSFGAFEPYVSATYEHDYSLTEIAVTTGPQPENDRDDVLFGAGLRYFGANNGISGNLDWTRRLGRSDYDEDIFTASIRVDF